MTLIQGNYHQQPGINQSVLKQILKSPKHYRLALTPREPTKAMVLGSAFHMCVLQSNLFPLKYCVIDGHRGSSAVKLAIENAETQGKVVLKSEERQELVDMAEAINSHKKAAQLLHSGLVEVGMDWHEGDITYKAKPDLIREDGFFVDLKTTTDASPEHFARSFFDFGYDFQMAFYQEGLKQNGFGDLEPVIVAVENAAPHCVCVYHIPEDALEYGRKRVRQAKERLRECLQSNNWPGYSDDVIELTIPKYIERVIYE